MTPLMIAVTVIGGLMALKAIGRALERFARDEELKAMGHDE